MVTIRNLTPYEATWFPSMSLQDEELVVVVVAARFDMPAPSANTQIVLAHSVRQSPVQLADKYYGEPGHSSLMYEGQSAFMRLGTDIYVNGHAHASRGSRVSRSLIHVRVGACQKSAAVFGDRYWRGTSASEPEPFDKIPLTYEYCFGGHIPDPEAESEIEPRDAVAMEHNPVGVGLYAKPAGQRLPNIENPKSLVSTPDDRPLPQGFGPVARSWLPRRQFAGSYTSAWLSERAPLWPSDFDPKFFSAAAPGLHVPQQLVGGELVELIGLHVDGEIRFRLPTLRLRAKIKFSRREEIRPLLVDAVLLDPDALAVTLIMRASAAARPSVLDMTGIVLRASEAWEADA